MVVRDEGPQGKRSPGLFLSQGTRVLVSSPTCLVLLASIPEKYIHASFGQNLANLVSTLPPPPKSNFSTVTIRYFPVSKKCRGHGEVVTLPFNPADQTQNARPDLFTFVRLPTPPHGFSAIESENPFSLSLSLSLTWPGSIPGRPSGTRNRPSAFLFLHRETPQRTGRVIPPVRRYKRLESPGVGQAKKKPKNATFGMARGGGISGTSLSLSLSLRFAGFFSPSAKLSAS